MDPGRDNIGKTLHPVPRAPAPFINPYHTTMTLSGIEEKEEKEESVSMSQSERNTAEGGEGEEEGGPVHVYNSPTPTPGADPDINLPEASLSRKEGEDDPTAPAKKEEYKPSPMLFSRPPPPPPWENLHKLEDVITPPTFDLTTPPDLQKIAIEFNKGIIPGKNALKTVGFTFATDWIRVPENGLVLATRNKVAELFPYNRRAYVKNTSWLKWGVDIKIIPNETKRQYDFTLADKFFGTEGRHVLVVAEGEYALVSLNLQNKILGEGVHVINAVQFSFNPAKNYIKKNNPHIAHGNYNIINVALGQIALVVDDGIPRLLESRNTPYVFTSSNFKFVRWENVRTPLIEHHSLKRLVLEADQTAIISREGKLTYQHYTGTPILINHANIKVIGIISGRRQQCILPLDIKNEKSVSYNSADSIRITLKIQVFYQVTDIPKLIENKLTITKNIDKDVAQLIERDALRRVGQGIQKAKISIHLLPQPGLPESNPIVPTDIINTIQEEAMSALERDLGVFGISISTIRLFDVEPHPSLEHELRLNSNVTEFFAQKKYKKDIQKFLGITQEEGKSNTLVPG